MIDKLQERGRTSKNLVASVLQEQRANSLCNDISTTPPGAPTDRLSVGAAKVIPPPGKSLQFVSSESDPRLALYIDPASEDDYYYVTLVSWGHESGEGFSHAEGPRLPVFKEQVWETCQHYEAEHLVENGERMELTSDPLRRNRWLYQGQHPPAFATSDV